MKSGYFITLTLIAVFNYHCSNDSKGAVTRKNVIPEQPVRKINKDGVRAIHVFVALCDNKYQGIVPVGKTIGNGQDPDNNLYWGCENGVRTYFKKKNSDWVLLKSEKKPSDHILERILFKHKTRNVYLLADAYDGQFIKRTTIDFLSAAAGKESLKSFYKNDTVYFGGASNLISYIGHDGLMDFKLPVASPSDNHLTRDAIILACYSKNYFSEHLRSAGAEPLVWTTGLMAPEAYTLHDALREWVNNKSRDEIRVAAAKAYSKFQKCSIRAAKNLLVTGW